MKIQKHKFHGVYTAKKGKRVSFYTKNIVPGTAVYGETLVKDGGVEYREWDTRRSKLGAALAKGISQLGLYPDSVVLYLGASTGTTSSHVSDLVGRDGFVFALDFAPRTTRNLVFVCETRENMCPIMADAKFPEHYAHRISSVDAIFQDIAQRDQAGIFLRNCKTFLRRGGFGILTLKARSVDVTKKPKAVFDDVRKQLEKEITIVDYRTLDPFEKDHCIFICKKK